jgi:hypothetical protein
VTRARIEWNEAAERLYCQLIEVVESSADFEWEPLHLSEGIFRGAECEGYVSSPCVASCANCRIEVSIGVVPPATIS